jgi:eukaryotic-like serine/threonine-protein kinase
MSTWNPKANEIFLHALELGSDQERCEYLHAVCAADSSLRADVEALLAAGDRAGSFLESPAVAPYFLATVEQPIAERPVAERPGTIIGPYKLLEQIGEGGFGIVFMAEQQQPVRRKVALKVLKPGMDTRQVIARFEAERQALALMDHPNIAKVLDAGQTASGRPFFVMDLVRGIPITEYSDRNQLTPRERLELFVHVCHAIQHAHQKGIIHRDIKPSNVLITLHDGEALVKVIDFGVAKALGQQLTEKTLFTGFAQIIGTPLYMSPEQAAMSNVDVDTRSDIYSLGVLLYELLTGTTPFDKERLKSAAFDEIRRIIHEDEPPKPSTRLSDLGRSGTHRGRSLAGQTEATTRLASIAAQRKTEPRKLSRLFRGELDWIVMKALEKDRNRRYETANGFALDIERYLTDEPVAACPPSAVYRLQKFARRNKAAFVIGAAIGAALLIAVVALAVSNILVRRQSREKELALKEKTQALGERALALQEKENALSEKEKALDRARYHEGVANETAAEADTVLETLLNTGENAPKWLADTPDQRDRIRHHYDSLDKVLLRAGYAQRAATEFSRTIERYPQEPRFFYGRGLLYAQAGLCDFAARDFAKAFDLDEPGEAWFLIHALLRVHVADGPGYRDACRRMLARFEGSTNPDDWNNVASALVISAASDVEPSRAVALAERAVADNKLVWRVAYLGMAYYRAGELERAVALLEESLAVDASWNPCWVQSALAMARHQQGNRDDDAASLERAHSARQERAEAMLAVPVGSWAMPWWDTAYAELLYKEAWALIHGLAPPDDAPVLVLRGRGLELIGHADEARAEFAKAFAIQPGNLLIRVRALPHISRSGAFAQGLADLRTRLQEQPDQTLAARLAIASAHLQWAARQAKAGVRHDAETALAYAVQIAPPSAEAASLRVGCADVYVLLGDWKMAIAQFAKCVELAPDDAMISDNFARLLVTCPDETFRDPRRAVELCRRALESNPDNAKLSSTLGLAQYRAGDWQAAIATLSKACELRQGGDAIDWFFLALAHGRLGQMDDARRWHKQAIEWVNKNAEILAANPKWAADLRRFRTEAEDLLGKKEP